MQFASVFLLRFRHTLCCQPYASVSHAVTWASFCFFATIQLESGLLPASSYCAARLGIVLTIIRLHHPLQPRHSADNECERGYCRGRCCRSGSASPTVCFGLIISPSRVLCVVIFSSVCLFELWFPSFLDPWLFSAAAAVASHCPHACSCLGLLSRRTVGKLRQKFEHSHSEEACLPADPQPVRLSLPAYRFRVPQAPQACPEATPKPQPKPQVLPRPKSTSVSDQLWSAWSRTASDSISVVFLTVLIGKTMTEKRTSAVVMISDLLSGIMKESVCFAWHRIGHPRCVCVSMSIKALPGLERSVLSIWLWMCVLSPLRGECSNNNRRMVPLNQVVRRLAFLMKLCAIVICSRSVQCSAVCGSLVKVCPVR